MQNKIAILAPVRVQSQRLPGKLFFRFRSGESLLSRSLKFQTHLLSACENQVDIFVPHAFDNNDLTREVQKFSAIKTFPLTFNQRNAECFDDLYPPMKHRFDEYDRVIIGNFVCRPFVRLQTWLDIINIASDNIPSDRPFVCTIMEHGAIWDGKGEPVYGCTQTSNSKANPLYQRFSHLAMALQPHYLNSSRELMANIFPLPIALNRAEQVDIDTQDDWNFAYDYESSS